jgi:hypothetical protein
MLWDYIKQLVGNGKAATIGIFAFIVILCLCFCHKANAGEIDLRLGSSFGTEGTGPVIGLQYQQPLAGMNQVNFFAGTLLWGSTTYNNQTVPNNWDWHAGLEGCHDRLCAGLGATYVQRTDSINGGHPNFFLQLSYKIDWGRFSSLDIVHISDAGTTSVNIGRQAVLGSFRLQ